MNPRPPVLRSWVYMLRTAFKLTLNDPAGEMNKAILEGFSYSTSGPQKQRFYLKLRPVPANRKIRVVGSRPVLRGQGYLVVVVVGN